MLLADRWSQGRSQLVSLDLRGNCITCIGAQSLATLLPVHLVRGFVFNCVLFQSTSVLRSLILAFNRIGREGTRSLAECMKVVGLSHVLLKSLALPGENGVDGAIFEWLRHWRRRLHCTCGLADGARVYSPLFR